MNQDQPTTIAPSSNRSTVITVVIMIAMAVAALTFLFSNLGGRDPHLRLLAMLSELRQENNAAVAAGAPYDLAARMAAAAHTNRTELRRLSLSNKEEIAVVAAYSGCIYDSNEAVIRGTSLEPNTKTSAIDGRPLPGALDNFGCAKDTADGSYWIYTTMKSPRG